MVNKTSKKEDRIYTCEKCGKVREAKYPAFKKRFCSHKCSNQWKWDNLYDKGKDVECTMLCGDFTWMRRGELTDDGRPIRPKFCSRKCFGKYRETAYLPFLRGFDKGNKPWNTGITMSLDYRIICKERAKLQWKDLEFREKQGNRTDREKLQKAGEKALKIYWSKPENQWRRKVAGKTLHKKFLEKVGVIANE